MIQFLVPWAGVGLALLAGPLLVHMLLRRNARRVRFPATRFLVETRAAAVRLRRPTDLALLMLRLGIVGASIAAAAQPILITPWRLSQWDERVIRAVVVDTSASVAQGADTARLAEQELAAFRAQRFDGEDLRDQLTQAAAWFEEAPPGRREVVILSDFQRGSLEREDLAILPSGVGIRTIRAAAAPSRDAQLPRIGGYRGATWQPSMRVDAAGTAVMWRRSSDTPPVPWLTTAQKEGERDAASRAVQAAMSAGVAPGDDGRRVRIEFAGATADRGDRHAVRTAWMADAVLALRGSALLQETNATVQTAEQGGQLVVQTTVAAASTEAPAVVRAVLLAVRPATIADREAEIMTLSDAELASWRREAAPVSGTPERPGAGTESDARWFWVLAVALLGAETWVRRRETESISRQVRDAA